MKLNFGRKLLLFVHWLVSLIICINAVLKFVFPDVMQTIVDFAMNSIGMAGVRGIGIGIAAMYVITMVFTVAMIFSNKEKRSERGFIVVDSSDSGKTRIAVGAVEQMIRQAMNKIDGVAEMKSAIAVDDDAITIKTNVSLVEGAHVPTVTMNIQRSIRSYIELNCGVAVREVIVNVNAVASGDEKSKRGGKKAVVETIPAVIVPEELTAQQPVWSTDPDAAVETEDQLLQEKAELNDEIKLCMDSAEEEMPEKETTEQ